MTVKVQQPSWKRVTRQKQQQGSASNIDSNTESSADVLSPCSRHSLLDLACHQRCTWLDQARRDSGRKLYLFGPSHSFSCSYGSLNYNRSKTNHGRWQWRHCPCIYCHLAMLEPFDMIQSKVYLSLLSLVADDFVHVTHHWRSKKFRWSIAS